MYQVHDKETTMTVLVILWIIYLSLLIKLLNKDFSAKNYKKKRNLARASTKRSIQQAEVNVKKSVDVRSRKISNPGRRKTAVRRGK